MWHYSKKRYPKYARVAYLCIETTHSASWHQNAMQECWPKAKPAQNGTRGALQGFQTHHLLMSQVRIVHHIRLKNTKPQGTGPYASDAPKIKEEGSP